MARRKQTTTEPDEAALSDSTEGVAAPQESVMSLGVYLLGRRDLPATLAAALRALHPLAKRTRSQWDEATDALLRRPVT